MNWELILLLTGIMLFSYWLNYIMGSPLATDPNDIDVKAILFPGFLGKRRLRQYGLYVGRKNSLAQDLSVTKDKATKRKTIIDARLGDFLEARELFTWERAILCAICFHWWLSVLIGIIWLSFDFMNARADFFQAVLAYLVLHLIIRKIS